MRDFYAMDLIQYDMAFIYGKHLVIDAMKYCFQWIRIKRRTSGPLSLRPSTNQRPQRAAASALLPHRPCRSTGPT
jgi:hypothetical protein